eukprot:TRINITY_DN14225_c0_g1_i3.p1 TRINITY_DN14225_c0_g1~~TRINITY_DN14225_c0_g1_i3.p1  ORF type:complete len:942 (-),score=213.51 TRINITY_DN14225_c0_g1_i3:82-2907(-)
MIRRPPRSTLSSSSAASDVYKRQEYGGPPDPSMATKLFLGFGLLAVACAAPTKTGNMNGKYLTASVDKVGVPFNDDYASKGHEYFDVWAPEMATHYGEVFWTSQGTLPLPPAIVERFKGKVMAITGYEQDQVMVVPTGQPGVNPDQDVSVPINWAYNHHYMAWMTGAHSELEEVECDPNDVSSHGAPTKWVAVDKPSALPRKFADVAPTSQMFSEGNGGESRKSFHGYPDGFAQLIESPDSWTITPMQIDTRNRDCGSTYKDVGNCTQMLPAYEPRSARYGRNWQGKDKPALPSNYSGILECPCNSRYGGDPIFYPSPIKSKIVTHNYVVLPSGACSSTQAIWDAQECFSVVAGTLGIGATKFENATVSDKTLPQGCSVMTHSDGSATTTFNSAESSTPCSGAKTQVGESMLTSVGVTLKAELVSTSETSVMTPSPKGQYCAQNKVGVIKSFHAGSDSQADMLAALQLCNAFCQTDSTCNFCSVDNLATAPGKLDVQFSALPICGANLTWGGAVVGDISSKATTDTGTATITLTGPSDVWFGVGLAAQNMADAPYTLIVNSTGVTERQIGTCGSEAEHCPGDQLANSLTLVSNTVSNNLRTVVITRPLKGLTAKHYSFHPSQVGTLNFISAVGSSQAFAYHKNHAAGVVSFTATEVPSCVCDTGAEGKLCAGNGTGCDSFVKQCLDHSQGGDLGSQHNPTCNSLQYAGGLRCCGHKRIMLDEDQPVRPELLQYHMKFRFWFQEYQPANATKTPQGTTQNTTASHYDLPRIYFTTEANAGEYDIPPAFATKEQPTIPGYAKWPLDKMTPGTSCTGTCPGGADCECVHTITYNHTVSNMRLIYAGGHCHAPSCLGIWLYRNDPGHEMELLCQQQPVYGTGQVHLDKYDEAGYITLPPCLWGEDLSLIHISEPTRLLSISYAVFCLKKKKKKNRMIEKMSKSKY